MGLDRPGAAGKSGGASGNGPKLVGWRTTVLWPLLGLVGLFFYSKSRFDDLEALAKGPAFDQPSQAYLPPQLRTVGMKPGLVFRSYYVPVDAQLYHAGGRVLPLEATLVLRNPSPAESIYVSQVDYFGADGTKIRTFAKKLFELAPMQTLEFSTMSRGEEDRKGSHFIVKWGAKPQVRPLIETVMVDERAHVVVRREGTLMRSSPSAPRGRGERRMRTTSEKPVATYELKKDPPSGELRPKNP